MIAGRGRSDTGEGSGSASAGDRTGTAAGDPRATGSHAARLLGLGVGGNFEASYLLPRLSVDGPDPASLSFLGRLRKRGL